MAAIGPEKPLKTVEAISKPGCGCLILYMDRVNVTHQRVLKLLLGYAARTRYGHLECALAVAPYVLCLLK
ncbi:hypothetical protein Pla110_45220 [Polystyrenella longa]|uniref:Uncharacterized protein n=1 Tax=Polystyrenella longa TaxID=2528007 RepID=A0A518CU51_9PLAN|nr:hypothetical protein Pla110_45220 [Polystyrenella longa]